MRIEEALRARLVGDVEVAGIVGTRVWPAAAPRQGVEGQGYVTYERVDGAAENGHDSVGMGGLRRARLTYMCAGGSYGEVVALAEAVAGCLNGFAGVVGDVRIGSCLVVEDGVDFYDEGLRLALRAVDVRVYYSV